MSRLRSIAVERWLNDACRCLDSDVVPGACLCGGAGARRFVELWQSDRWRTCLRCGRPGLMGRLCSDCAPIVDAERSPQPTAPSYRCALCTARHGAAIDLGGTFLCEVCSSWDLWGGPFPERGSHALPACSFCGEVPRRAAIIAGPAAYVCSPCIAGARALRPIDRRDPPRDTPRACSFDGKSFRELRELFVVGDLSFCDECMGLFDDILPAADMRARLGLARGTEADRCAVCGGHEAVQTPERGPSLCAKCVNAGRRVGRWCLRCDRGIAPAERVARIGDRFLCASCTDGEVHTAKLVAFAAR